MVLKIFFDAVGTIGGDDVDETIFEYCSFVDSVLIVVFPICKSRI